MAAITPFLADRGFNQDDIESLSAALDEAMRRVKVEHDPTDLKQALAKAIVHAGQTGIRDREALARFALHSIGIEADGRRH